MLDEDLLSLELPNNFLHYMLQDDDSYKVYAQKSIIRLETVFGHIKHKFAKGNVSASILNKIKQHNQQSGQRGTSDQQAGISFDAEIDALIMLDRSIDLVSPFCVQ